MPMRIVLVDDTHMFRDGLKLVLEHYGDIQVVGEAADGADGVDVVLKERPDLVLMDIRMPRMDGVAATRQIKAALPNTQVLVLTTYSDDAYIADALRAGATGYLLKDMHSKDLLQAIRAVHQGGVLILPPVAARLIADSYSAPAGAAHPTDASEGQAHRADDLTPREHEILRLVAKGLTNREVADLLIVSEGTVKNHLSAIYAKLHARDRAQAVSFALRQGLVN